MPEMASVAPAYSAPAETGCECYRTPSEGRWAGRRRVKSVAVFPFGAEAVVAWREAL